MYCSILFYANLKRRPSSENMNGLEISLHLANWSYLYPFSISARINENPYDEDVDDNITFDDFDGEDEEIDDVSSRFSQLSVVGYYACINNIIC